MIVSKFFTKKQSLGQPLYAAIVAAARQPKFYANWGVADTIDGRFDMVVLHLYLVLARLKNDAPQLCQSLTNQFSDDMDGNLRELGVGDLGVGKRVRHMAEALQGRVRAYDQASDEATLVEALTRNVYQGKTVDHAIDLAQWMINARQILAQYPTAALVDGKVRFEDEESNSPS